MARTKNIKKNIASTAEAVFDVAAGVLGNLPNITLYGTSMVEIDNFKALLDFSQNTVRVNTTDGVLRIDGFNLKLAFMTDESVSIKGSIKNLSFE